MKFLTFDQIKGQLRLDDQQVNDEHDLLELYGDAAEETVLNICNRTFTEIYERYGGIPKALSQAALMLVAQSYQHREPSSTQNIYANPAFDMLVKPYIKLTDNQETNNNNNGYGRHCNL